MVEPIVLQKVFAKFIETKEENGDKEGYGLDAEPVARLPSEARNSIVGGPIPDEPEFDFDGEKELEPSENDEETKADNDCR